MAVKTYDVTALVQRMVDVYTDTIRYHSSHWQTLNGSHRSYGTRGAADAWITVPDDTIFITNIFQSLQRQLLSLEEHTAMRAAIIGLSVSSFITAAQTQFTA